VQAVTIQCLLQLAQQPGFLQGDAIPMQGGSLLPASDQTALPVVIHIQANRVRAPSKRAEK
jgi:hypothetical protein